MPLTPEQFNKLATKNDFQEIKSDISEVKRDMKLLLTAVDGLARKTVKIEEEFVSNQAAHDRMQKVIGRHEIKIKSLEVKRFIK